MKEITLAPIPNQSFSIQLDNRLYDIEIKETNDVMSATITRDQVVIISGARIVAGFPLIPSRYQEDGNFIILTANGDYPYYDKFGDTQTMVYASAAELGAIRGT